MQAISHIRLNGAMKNCSAIAVLQALRRWKVYSGLNQPEIASRSGVHQSQISRILRGDFKRISKNVRRLCKFAKINLHGGKRSSALLEDSLRDLWDGSKTQEKALARLLAAVGGLVHSSATQKLPTSRATRSSKNQ
jgi:transcriptional regulator with XRE-family HTH domain